MALFFCILFKLAILISLIHMLRQQESSSGGKADVKAEWREQRSDNNPGAL